VTLAFGREVQFVPAPISGTLELFGVDYSLYRLLLVPTALIVAGLFAGLLNGTRLGLSTRAVIMNENLAQGLGIDSTRVRLITFGIGRPRRRRWRPDHAAGERRSQYGPGLADRRLCW
jgi:branched-chain amino acid transport system permease protein